MVSSKNRIRRRKIQCEAEGYLELGLPQQALDALARLGDPVGFDPHTLYLWGQALRELERYPEAVVSLQRVVEAAPESIHVWLALGWCYKRTARLDMAIDALDKALALKPAEALVHYNLACYWSLAGDKGRALAYLERALAIDSDYARLIDDEPDFDPLRCDPEFRALCAESDC